MEATSHCSFDYMPSVLDFDRYSGDLNRQLLRRIGYTNGLHKIMRFARVVEYLYPVMPTSAPVLAQVIIDEENKRTSQAERQLSGVKYATGIVDVAQALSLIEKFGPKLSLSSEGYACHALMGQNASDNVLHSFLLEKVIEADGECTLNILRLVQEGIYEVMEIGARLMDRLLALIRFKILWAEQKITDRFAQRAIVTLLHDAEGTLRSALNPDSPFKLRRRQKKAVLAAPDEPQESPVEFFYKHTVSPRLEWLEDLGCIEKDTTSSLIPTAKGERLLDEVRRSGGWEQAMIFLPLNVWLAEHLGVPNLYALEKATDFGWRFVASANSALVSRSKIFDDHQELLSKIKHLYPAVKLANFNEADATSIYDALASADVVSGNVIALSEFEKVLAELVAEFPSDIFKLSKRRGKGLYIAVKRF